MRANADAFDAVRRGPRRVRPVVTGAVRVRYPTTNDLYAAIAAATATHFPMIREWNHAVPTGDDDGDGDDTVRATLVTAVPRDTHTGNVAAFARDVVTRIVGMREPDDTEAVRVYVGRNAPIAVTRTPESSGRGMHVLATFALSRT